MSKKTTTQKPVLLQGRKIILGEGREISVSVNPNKECKLNGSIIICKSPAFKKEGGQRVLMLSEQACSALVQLILTRYNIGYLLLPGKKIQVGPYGAGIIEDSNPASVFMPRMTDGDIPQSIVAGPKAKLEEAGYEFMNPAFTSSAPSCQHFTPKPAGLGKGKPAVKPRRK